MHTGYFVLLSEHGNMDSGYGWHIDHIDPNGDDLSNLQPLQWENNIDKSDGQLKCKITAQGVDNVEK